MNSNTKSILEDLSTIFSSTDEALSEWSGDGNLQFPVLLGMVAVRLNWNEKKVREADPIIRYYVRNHSEWHVTRGAHGGIMPKSEWQKKEDLKTAKEVAKSKIQALLNEGPVSKDSE